MELSEEQKKVFELYKKGENIFLSGPGGSGKTFLIQKIYKDAISCNKKIQVCAMTGCAANLLNTKAKTLHSWAGIGLASGPIDKIILKVLKRMKYNLFLYNSWTKLNILIIDEISMMSLKLFNVINMLGQKVRKNDTVFGGIQIIFSGDFYQLPPVFNSMDAREDPDISKFCFESSLWNSVFKKENQIQLTQIFRQKDPIYSRILNEIRIGELQLESFKILESCLNKPLPEGIVPTKLFPTKKLVYEINQKN